MRRLALVATAAVLLTAGTASTAAARPPGHVPAMRSYVVLYAKHASFTAAERAIRRAGGRIVRTNRAVGLATVTAPARGFARKIRAARSLVGAAQNRVIGRARLRQKHSVERAKGEAGGAVAAAEPGAGEPLASLQWDMQMIDATPAGSYAVQQGSHDVLVGVIDTGMDASTPTSRRTSTPR